MRVRASGVTAIVLAILLAGDCGYRLGRQYEYEEQLYLQVDGSATVIVDASLPAFVGLRGLPVNPALRARTDRDELRRVFESGGCHVASVGQVWRRNGRRFIQIRLETADVRTLSTCQPLAWSTYRFDRTANSLHYHQMVGAPANGNPGDVNWDGSEVVAFKLHLPSRIVWQNVKRLDTGANGEVERGNILTWEQRLADRRAGQPVDIDVEVDPQSILYRTLWLFAGAVLAAVVTLVVSVWLTMRLGRRGLTTRRPPV